MDCFQWKELWRAPCEPKAKHPLWRIGHIHNSLPTLPGIKRRGMEIDALCPVCGRLDEDGGHLSLRCKEVGKVWNGLDLAAERQKLADCADHQDFLHAILALPAPTKMLIISPLWTWWRRHNKVNSEGKKLNIKEVLVQVRRTAGDEVLRINIDGCFIPEGKTGRWGLHHTGFLE